MSTALVWFRRDLRLADNPALHHALNSHDTVIPIFILDDPDQWPMGAASRVWLHHSLRALDKQLHDLGSQLIIREGDAGKSLDEMINLVDAQSVYWNRCYEPSAIQRDTQIKQALTQRGLEIKSYNANLLIEPWNIATQQDKPYRVFTPYWKNLKSQPIDRALPEPDTLPPVSNKIPNSDISDLKLIPKLDWHEGMMADWIPGEDGAHEALDIFLDGPIPHYKEGRDRPDKRDTSCLSPHLHFGEISPRQIWHAVLERVARGGAGIEKGAETYLKELGWRDFAYHLLYHFPKTTDKPLDERFEAFPWQTATTTLSAWQQGQTGLPIVDAGMRQLWQTGWMHNRVRMIVASFLTKNLRIHWLEGARWFWDTLVDADLASNTLGWQWTAGCGADAAPFFRIFNPVSQGERFDPQGKYVRRWVPEIAELPDKYLHSPWTASDDLLASAGITLGGNYPKPLVDLKTSRQAALDAWQGIKSD